VLVLTIRAPERRTGFYAVRGHRVFGVPARAVTGVTVVLGDRRFAAERHGETWTIDGRPATPGTAAALQDLATTLAGLRSVDVFRARDGASYGLGQPHGWVELRTARVRRRLDLGDLTAGGGTLYARRTGDPRVLQIGTGLLSSFERVLYERDGRPPTPAPDALSDAQRHEIG
jgi:hypothetical protein